MVWGCGGWRWRFESWVGRKSGLRQGRGWEGLEAGKSSQAAGKEQAAKSGWRVLGSLTL